MTDTLTQAQLSALCWKSPKCIAIGVAILNRLLEHSEAYADEFPLGFVEPQDKNLIGLTMKLLQQNKLIAPTGRFRKSTFKAAHSRVVFAWQILHSGLAREFVRRHGGKPYSNQSELFQEAV